MAECPGDYIPQNTWPHGSCTAVRSGVPRTSVHTVHSSMDMRTHASDSQTRQHQQLLYMMYEQVCVDFSLKSISTSWYDTTVIPTVQVNSPVNHKLQDRVEILENISLEIVSR